MAKLTAISIPEAGTPLDVSYLSQIVNSINGLTEQFNEGSAVSSVSTAKASESAKLVRTSTLTFFTRTVLIPKTSTQHTVTIDSNVYKDPPAVFCTVEGASDHVYVNSSGTNSIILAVNTTGGASKDLLVHVLAVGISPLAE